MYALAEYVGTTACSESAYSVIRTTLNTTFNLCRVKAEETNKAIPKSKQFHEEDNASERSCSGTESFTADIRV